MRVNGILLQGKVPGWAGARGPLAQPAVAGEVCRLPQDLGFEEVFATEHRSLMRFCWALALDPHEATDLAQEAMARAYRDWDRLRAGNPAGWVRSVAMNLARTNWRSSKRRDKALGRLRAVTPTESKDRPPISDDVIAALRSLTDRQREAVVLHHMFDVAVADVAVQMGISEASVKTHLQRGRDSLAHLLVAHDNPEATSQMQPDANPLGGGENA